MNLPQWIKQIAFSFFIFLALIGVVELGMRARQYVKYRTWQVPGWLCDGKPETAVWHPFLRTVPAPGVMWQEVEGGRKTLIRSSSLGFRSEDVPEQKRPGTLRVICVGGSVVYDTRVGWDEAWPNQLQKGLRQRYTNQVIEVLNAGIPSRTSADSLVNIGLRLLALSPDVIIVLHGVNDQKPNRYPGFKPDYSHWYQKPEVPGARTYLNQLLDHSLFLAHVRYRVRFLVNPWLRENWRGEPMERYDEVTKPGLDAYKRNLESIIGMCRMQKVDVVFATAGHSLDGNVDWNPGMGTRNPLVNYHDCLTLKGIKDGFLKYNGVMRAVAASNDCVLVDLEKLLPEGKEWYQDDVHYTAKGSKKVAGIFLDQVPWSRWVK